ncbi:NFACT family protein [uncultured Helicobacter sp.]|uniref:NFACT family protein n=1 Tax=uncultured Helicobacter sp. TaxID=175537 RepID=UPI00374F4D72
MNLGLLKGISAHFSCFSKIYWCRRVDDNLLALNLEGKVFYLDLTRSQSMIFCAKEAILGAKSYHAPFDIKLGLCHNARLLKSQVDGDNRILQLRFTPQNAYKKQEFTLELEFTGKHTNAILLDSKRVVIEALRHISESIRPVRVGKPLDPLPQPTNPKPSEIVAVSDELLEELYHNRTDRLLHTAKAQQLKSIESKETNIKQLLQEIPKTSALQELAARYSLYAHTITAHLHELDSEDIHRDCISLSCLDSAGLDSKQCVQIPILERTASFSQLAQRYFALSKKSAKKAQNLHLQIQNLESSLQFLNAQKSLIENAQTLADLKIFSPPKSHKRLKKHQNFEVFFINGMKIGVGKNSTQNLALLKSASGEDIWLHICDIPSSHMIIFCGKAKARDEVISKAGEILVGLCGVKTGRFRVDYTRRKFVKITQGANVVYGKYQSLEYSK